MDRAYREDELIGATVIDSEGYIYGKVGEISVGEDEVILVAYESKPDVKTVTDMDTLKEELLKNVKISLGSRLQRRSPTEVLTQNIREELGLRPAEPLTDQHYVRYAERLGVYIPKRKVEVEREEPKGSLGLKDIKAIRVSVVPAQHQEKVVKIVLLNEPREASFRRIPIQERVPYRDARALKDKLVLDAQGVALGYVDSLVFFRGMPGIRVYLPKRTEYVDLRKLNQYLDEVGRSTLAKMIKRQFTWDNVRRDELEDFLRTIGAFFTLPEDAVLTQHVKALVMDVPWDVVHKIGDVIILRMTLPDLRSKGYLLR